MNLRDYLTVRERREALQKATGKKFPAVGRSLADEEEAGKRNCENMIGAVGVPVGVAGPLLVRSPKSPNRSYYVPLATTEGALVASVNRGMRAIFESGGVYAETDNIGTTRGPVFATGSLRKSRELEKYILDNREKLAGIAGATSHHLKLTDIVCQPLGGRLYARFAFDTKDAMGMNMVTVATQAITDFVSENIGVRVMAVAGNFDIDKKPAWLNAIAGRGYRVWAETLISGHTINTVLKTSAENMFKVWLSKCMLGSALSGSMAYNCHFANVAAAIFIATGQDPAHVVEASLGVTVVEAIGKDAAVSVYLPDLMAGTVGGGTVLAAQKEMLELMGVAGSKDGKNRRILSEIVAGSVLAGEISLLASLAEGTLTRSHERLARGKAGK